MSSWFWVVVIVLGGSLVVIGNIQYARSKGSEDKAAPAAIAREVIQPELVRNQTILAQWRTTIGEGAIPFQQFEVAAWDTVSSGNMLTGLNAEELRSFARVYEGLVKANSTQHSLMELAVGVASALQDAVQHKNYLIGNLQVQLNEIEAALGEAQLPANP